jgi:predicted ribosomally synthesized peptide with nif11-like leader
MSAKSFAAFLEHLKNDRHLQAKLAAPGANIIALAQQAGFELSPADLEPSRSELDGDELDQVAGGFGSPSMPTMDFGNLRCLAHTSRLFCGD